MACTKSVAQALYSSHNEGFPSSKWSTIVWQLHNTRGLIGTSMIGKSVKRAKAKVRGQFRVHSLLAISNMSLLKERIAAPIPLLQLQRNHPSTDAKWPSTSVSLVQFESSFESWVNASQSSQFYPMPGEVVCQNWLCFSFFDLGQLPFCVDLQTYDVAAPHTMTLGITSSSIALPVRSSVWVLLHASWRPKFKSRRKYGHRPKHVTLWWGKVGAICAGNQKLRGREGLLCLFCSTERELDNLFLNPTQARYTDLDWVESSTLAHGEQ